MNGNPELVFPVISDVHIDDGSAADMNKFRTAMDQLNKAAPKQDAFVVIGDLTDNTCTLDKAVVNPTVTTVNIAENLFFAFKINTSYLSFSPLNYEIVLKKDKYPLYFKIFMLITKKA